MNTRMQANFDLEIASLSSMIQHAQTKGDAVHSDVFQELQSLKDQRNALSSISKLPEELLSTIFEETKRIYIQTSRCNAELDPSNASSYRKSQSSWLDIAKVCRRWSEVAFRNPRLWSDIELNDQIKCIQEMLRRSKSAPLTVWCRVHVYDAVFQGRAAEAVMPHFSRFEELNVIAASLQSAREFLELIPDVRNVPHLRLFRLDVVKAQEDDEDDDDDDESASTLIIPKHVFQSHLPNLHTLDLEYGSFATQLPFLPSLAFLTFSCASASPRLTMSMLTASLRNTPNLRSLSIVNANFDISDFAFPLDPSQKVPLPHLRSMQIATGTVDMSLIFDLIDYPSTTDISFFASQIQELGQNEVSSLMNVCSHVAIDSFCSLAISFSDECVGILLAGEDFNPDGNHLFLALPPSSTPYVYLPLCTVPPFLEVPQLGLDGVTGDWIDSDFLSKFTEMVDLHFERCSSEIVQQLLVDDDEQDQEHRHLPMPKLCDLRFYRCSFHPVDSTMEVDEIEGLHAALVCLINQRRYIGPKLAHIEIRECHISQDMVWELENHVLVTWDRISSIPSDEYESGSEEEEEGMDTDSDSDPDWHPNDEFYERSKLEAVATPDDSSDDDISSAATDPGEEADAMDCEMETEEDDGDDIDREYGENRGGEDSYFFPDYYPSDDSHVWP